MGTLNRVLANYGPRPALAIDGRVWSYAEVIDAAADLAQLLQATDGGRLGLVGLLAHKSFAAYVGAVGAHLAGRGYVPLNVKFPPQRLAAMLRSSGTGALVVGPEGLPRLAELLEAAAGGPFCTIVGLGLESFAGLDKQHPTHRFVLAGRARRTDGLASPPAMPAAATAYLMFTSGSTGTPKGVPVSFGNLDAYVAHIIGQFPLEPDDRVSQTFDMTFDLSVHDLFITWASGACLYPLADVTLLNPAKFIREMALTAWFSVPSVAMFMGRARTLKPGVFPSLRLSLFCGEPLPVVTANAWSAAAPRSRVVNLYGPTEATIAIAAYEWNEEGRNGIPEGGTVPIGRVFAPQSFCLLAEGGQVTAGPGRGELCLAGSQVTEGYLTAPEKTAERYVALAALPGRWYRTGDLVEADTKAVLHFLGRIDFQVKVNGYRVELGELEATLRAASGCDAVVAVPWPASNGSAQGLVAFILGEPRESAAVLSFCRRALPDYMVPSRIVWKEALPLNPNGKIDRTALAAELETDARQGRREWQVK
jgi:amino acid adenylation domain-containing protein